MDLDAYTLAHEPDWVRLDALSKRSRLSGAEVDELVRLYQATATDLSMVRSGAPDARTVMRLSQVLSRARTRMTGANAPVWSEVARFFVVSFPAVVYRVRWWVFAVAAASVLVAVATGWYLADRPELLASVMSPADQATWIDQETNAYYEPTVGFASYVWTNNAWLAAQCVASGITGVIPVIVLANNALNLGVAGAVMATHGQLGHLLLMLAPHGLLELTSVFVAAAAGLRLFGAWLVPGPRPRGLALAEAGRALFTTVIGLAVTLGVSGLVEAFVTGSTMPWSVKCVIGVVVLAAFWTYVLTLGRTAARAGETGDLEPDRAGHAVATAA